MQLKKKATFPPQQKPLQPKPRSTDAVARDASWQLVQAAQAIDNPLATHLPKSSAFAGRPSSKAEPALCCGIECRRADALTPAEQEAVMAIIGDNMRQLYAGSAWGWKEGKKRREVMDDRHYFLLARRDAKESGQGGEIVGLANFRFDLDFESPVLYCYELQVRSDCQGQGLGKFLLLCLQLLAARCRMAKLMVTVFKANERTLKFFYGMKFTRDETDLGEQGENLDLDYVILSKATG